MQPSQESYDRDCVMRGIFLFWRTLGRVRGMIHQQGEIEYVFSESRRGPERIFGMNLPSNHAAQRLAAIKVEMLSGALPDSILVPLDPQPPNLIELLDQSGFAFDRSGVCMVMDLDDLKDPPPAPGIQVQVVDSLDKLRAWADILMAAFVGPGWMDFDQFCDLYSFDHVLIFLALDEGVPAAVSSLMLEPGTGLASLELVATLPAHRGRGLGSAATLAALSAMKAHGKTTATLRAEPGAINVYRQAGFHVVCPRIVASPKSD